MSTDNIKLAAAMRKTAEALRKEAAEHQKAHLEKCAQILVAARGLEALQQLIGRSAQ